MTNIAQRPNYANFALDFRLVFTHFTPDFAKSNQKILDFRDFTSKFGNFEYFFTNTLKHLYRGCYGQKIGWKTMLAISKIIGFENSKTPHNGFKSCFEWYKFCFSGLVFLRFRPKIDRFLVVSCDVLKQCEESVTIIDGECARFAKNMYCKIFIILAYSQYRRYKYSGMGGTYTHDLRL